MAKRYFSILLALALISTAFSKDNILPYKNPNLPIDQRVDDLLSRMTYKEKFWQLFMIPGDLDSPEAKEQYMNGIFGLQISARSQQSGNIAEQMINYEGGHNTTAAETARKINQIQKYFVEETRLGIPIIAFDEALHGLIRGGATAFPQSIAMAASWDTTLVSKVGKAVALEVKSRGIRDILSPVVNIASDVRWGRTEETYGEDPYLSSRMGVAYVSPFEKMGVITTPKHFIANVGDGGRDSYPIYANERLLREVYLPPFEACFKEAGSRSVMTAYNSLDAVACSSNKYLLRDILKDELGFKGFVISDAGAVGGACVLHMTAKDYEGSTEQAIEGGLDVIFQTDYNHWPLFFEAFNNGIINDKDIDDAVRRVLRAKFELGLFENPYVNENWAETENNSKDKQELCRQVARESFVLLKNENKTLPIDKTKISSIALIGGEIMNLRLGGYSGPGCEKVSIFDGIFNYLKKTNVRINYAHGADYMYKPYNTISAKDFPNGMTGKYFSNDTFSGNPVEIRKDSNIDFGWTLYSPIPDKIPYDCYSISWEGTLRAPKTGKFNIGIEGNDGYRLWINGELLIDNFEKKSYSTILKPYFFTEDKDYSIKVAYRETIGNARLKLIWDAEVLPWEKEIEEAVAAANSSDVAVIAVGIHEGEFQDRASLALPGKQIELINAVKATGKPVIVLLVGGSAITFSGWADGVDSIMDIWYPGEKGGYAVADVLFGDYSPSGKLPITFPVDEGQLPLVYNHRSTGRGDDYYNLTGQPLFPFGYGLSYTTFEYSNLNIGKISNKFFEVTFDLTNTGDYAGSEVAQLYIRDLITSVSQPTILLKDFSKVFLNPGETKQVSFMITEDKLKYLDGNMNWTVEPGEFKVMIGSSSKDIRLRSNITVE